MSLAKKPLMAEADAIEADPSARLTKGLPSHRFVGPPSILNHFWWLAIGCALGTGLLLAVTEPTKIAPAEAGTVALEAE